MGVRTVSRENSRRAYYTNISGQQVTVARNLEYTRYINQHSSNNIMYDDYSEDDDDDYYSVINDNVTITSWLSSEATFPFILALILFLLIIVFQSLF